MQESEINNSNAILLVSFSVFVRILVCSQVASGWESPDRPAGEKNKIFSSAGLILWYNTHCQGGKGQIPPPRYDRLPARETEIGQTRSWVASQESLRTSLVKTHWKALHCHLCGLTSSNATLRALSGASCDASEEVSVSRPLRCLKQGASHQERWDVYKMIDQNEFINVN